MHGAASRAPTVSIGSFRDDPLYPKVERAMAARWQRCKACSIADAGAHCARGFQGGSPVKDARLRPE